MSARLENSEIFYKKILLMILINLESFNDPILLAWRTWKAILILIQF